VHNPAICSRSREVAREAEESWTAGGVAYWEDGGAAGAVVGDDDIAGSVRGLRQDQEPRQELVVRLAWQQRREEKKAVCLG
jgi:hypothetical protein